MMTDDGTEGLATYTVPLAISKNVPFTFAVAKGSAVWDNDTKQTAVLDAVENHGCELAQHSVDVNWDTLSEAELIAFFDAEKTFFDSLDVEIKGAVVPAHRTNDLVKAVTGGRFGVVRCGYDGVGSDGNANYSVYNGYDYYCTGARSNMFALSSYNCSGTTDAYNKAAIDYAKANNKVLIAYYHEFDLDSAKKTVIESMIDYAKAQGLEFITLSQLLTIA